MSNVFAELCRLLEVRKNRTTARNPKGNGQAERFMKTLIRMIRAFLRGQQREWDLHLGCLAGAYRSTIHESTGFTPNMLMFGREVRLPSEVIFGTGITPLGETFNSYGEYVTQLRELMHKAHCLARQFLQKNAQRRKERYDTKQVSNSYQQGDLVWLMNEARYEEVCPKLQFPYTGPYLVLDRQGEFDYLIQMDGKGKTKNVHHD